MPEKSLSYKQTLQMRKNYIGKSCRLHFEVSPLKIVRASRQYLYDDAGNEYLDCITNTSHVGHCHPHVVNASQEQMARLTTNFGFLSENMSDYAKRIISTLPDNLCICFFLNSGSEANDFALRLARSYTKHNDVICLDHAYHGNISSVLEVSPSRYSKLGNSHVKKDWVHVAPTPYTFRGKYRDDSVDPAFDYAQEVKSCITQAKANGREIAAFICEPIMSAGGMIVYPSGYLQQAYRYVRETGGVCIADEVQTSCGRSGEHFWAFHTQGVVPDIVTMGKPMGNGNPVAAVITTKEIADSVGEFNSTFGGNPVACAAGLAVLEVIENEKLVSSAKSVGKCLLDSFRTMAPRHPMMGEVRGMGLLVGIELVMDKVSRKPAKEAAEILSYRMKENKIIIANDGVDKNVMIMTPPMCFTLDNARRVAQVFDQVLQDIENGAASVGLTSTTQSGEASSSSLVVPIEVLTKSNLTRVSDDEDDDDEECSVAKRARYEEMD